MKAGETVYLRSPGEILATLDSDGCLDGVPFMPEMLRFFAKPFVVTAQVNRACDTIGYTGPRQLTDTVTLDDLRCDGSGHAGCQAQCRLFWKVAWLRPASDQAEAAGEVDDEAFARLQQRVTTGAHAAASTSAEPIFRCQATELVRASEPVGRYRIGQELTSGNVGLSRFVRVTIRIVLEKLGQRLGLITFNAFHARQLAGQRRSAAPPARELRPGELVQIRTKGEIRGTLDAAGKTKGLWFDREMLPYCGQTARVQTKVGRFIDEGTGRMVELPSDCYILEGVVCSGELSENRWFCPRALYPWWRGAWLEPVQED